MKEPLCIYGGTGFVGSRFSRNHPDAIVQGRDVLSPATRNMICFISTVDNYNVYKNPYLDIETNLTTLIQILEAGKTRFGNTFTFTFISSWFVYGATDPIANEESPCNPTGFYSSTKLCAERLLVSYCETFGIEYKILRLANVLGIGDRKISPQKNAFQYLLKEISQNRDVKIYQVPSFRDFIDVEDVVRAIGLCMEDRYWNEIYNIGNGISYNVKELLYIAHERSQSTGKIEEIEVPAFHKLVQVADFRMSNKKIENLGYFPKFTIWETMDTLISHYRKDG